MRGRLGALKRKSFKREARHPGRGRAADYARDLLVVGILVAAGLPAVGAEAELRPYRVVGQSIPESLTGEPGRPGRGRAIVANRQVGLCILCHSGPFPEERFQGNLAPDLQGAGARWSEGELRLRIVDARAFNPETIMPPYYVVDGMARVAPAFRGRTVLSAEQIEDVVAYLTTLKDGAN